MKKILRKLPRYHFLKGVYLSIGNLHRRILNALYPSAHVLLYHSITKLDHDPDRLSVRPENFRAQLKFLKDHYSIISLATLVGQLKTGNLKKNQVVITFDDGYADNLTNALPILEELNIPATVFVTSGIIGKEKFCDIPPLTAEQLRTLCRSHLIEIGGHTVTHPQLSKISAEEQQKEILHCKPALEEICNMPIASFAYPYGAIDNFNATSVKLVREAGYSYACSNIHERVRPKSDIFTIPRFVIRNWPAEELANQMKKFL